MPCARDGREMTADKVLSLREIADAIMQASAPAGRNNVSVGPLDYYTIFKSRIHFSAE